MTDHATGYVYGELRAASVLPVRLRNFEIDGAGALSSGLMDSAREQARASGYAVGWAQGMRDAAERMAADVAESAALARAERDRCARSREDALQAMAAAVAQLESAAVPAAEELRDVIVAAALELAQALLHKELSASPSPIDTARRVLDLTPHGEPIEVRLAPADHAQLSTDGAAGVSADGAVSREIDGRIVTLVADPRLAAGDAIATTGASVIDGRLGPALERARAAVMA